MWNEMFYLIEALKLQDFFLCLARSKCSLSHWAQRDEPCSSSACVCPSLWGHPAPHVGTSSSSALVTFLPHLGLHHSKSTPRFGFPGGKHLWAEGVGCCSCQESLHRSTLLLMDGQEQPAFVLLEQIVNDTNIPVFHIQASPPRCLETSRANHTGKLVQCFPGSLSHLKLLLTCPLP